MESRNAVTEILQLLIVDFTIRCGINNTLQFLAALC